MHCWHRSQGHRLLAHVLVTSVTLEWPQICSHRVEFSARLDYTAAMFVQGVKQLVLLYTLLLFIIVGGNVRNDLRHTCKLDCTGRNLHTERVALSVFCFVLFFRKQVILSEWVFYPLHNYFKCRGFWLKLPSADMHYVSQNQILIRKFSSIFHCMYTDLCLSMYFPLKDKCNSDLTVCLHLHNSTCSGTTNEYIRIFPTGIHRTCLYIYKD